MDIIKEAKNIIYNSEIMQYVTQERIEVSFKRIHLYEDKVKFLEAYGRNDFDKNDRLEGFNRKDGTYLGPDATTHTVIHEVLHEISSKFDENGHRIKNGIIDDNNFLFGNQVNEGLTDYLATKLSKEEPRHYMQGHKLFQRLEPIMIKYTNDNDILMKLYLNNNVNFIREFLNYFGRKNTFENLYNNFLFMDDNSLNELVDDIEERLEKHLKRKDRKEKRINLIKRIKLLFLKKKTDLLLISDDKGNIKNKHKEFGDKYNINSFKTNGIQENKDFCNEYKKIKIENNHERFKE